MTIVNLSHELYDIFLRSGMDRRIEVVEMLECERLRQIFVEDCHRISGGGDANVYRFGEDIVLKEFKEEMGWNFARFVFVRGRHAFAEGIPTAIPMEMVRHEKFFCIIYERFGDTVSSLIIKNPIRLWELAEKMADLLRKELHFRIAPPACVSTIILWEEYMYKRLSRFLSKQEWCLIQKVISSIPDRRTCVHGDFHWDNVLEEDGKLYFIDMPSFGAGHPILDIAGVYSMSAGRSIEQAHENNDIWQHGWEIFRRRYFEISDTIELNYIDEMARFYSWFYRLVCLGDSVLEDARREWFPSIEENIERYRERLAAW